MAIMAPQALWRDLARRWKFRKECFLLACLTHWRSVLVCGWKWAHVRTRLLSEALLRHRWTDEKGRNRMRTINLDERDISLSELLAEFARGDYILLIKNGRQIARVFGMAEAAIPRELGTMKGQIWMAEDFDGPLPDDIQAAFDGK